MKNIRFESEEKSNHIINAYNRIVKKLKAVWAWMNELDGTPLPLSIDSGPNIYGVVETFWVFSELESLWS